MLKSSSDPNAQTPFAFAPDDSVLVWDFRGATCAATAAHFEKHLMAFLAREGFPLRVLGAFSESLIHAGVACPCTPAEDSALSVALKPQRSCTLAQFVEAYPEAFDSVTERQHS